MIKGYRREPPKISQICLFLRFSSLGALLKSSPFSHALAQTTILAEVNYTTSQRHSRAQWKHFFLVTVTQKAMIGRYSIFLHRMVLLLLLLCFFFSLSLHNILFLSISYFRYTTPIRLITFYFCSFLLTTFMTLVWLWLFFFLHVFLLCFVVSIFLRYFFFCSNQLSHTQQL